MNNDVRTHLIRCVFFALTVSLAGCFDSSGSLDEDSTAAVPGDGTGGDGGSTGGTGTGGVSNTGTGSGGGRTGVIDPNLEGLPPGTLSLVHWSEDRANRDFFDSKLQLDFVNRGGDWTDALGQPNGDVPFAVQPIESADYWQEVDVTELVMRWVSGQEINKGFLFKQFGERGTKISSKESANPPLLLIDLDDGTQLAHQAFIDTFLDIEETGTRGAKDFVDINTHRNGLIRFAIGELDPAAVVSATLSLHIKSKSGGDGGFEIYNCAQGGQTSRPDLGEPLWGVAFEYPNDVGLQAHPDVIHAERFESDNWVDHFEKNGSQRFVMVEGRNSLVSNDPQNVFMNLDGQALKATVAEGTHDGISAFYNFENRIGYQPEEIYFRYYLRFADNWEPSYNGKLPGIAHKGFDGEGVPTANGQSPSYGENTWSARGLFEPSEYEDLGARVPAGFYTYHTHQTQTSGEHLIWTNNYQGFLEKNRWYSIEMYIKMNSPNSDNGVMRTWVDGHLAYENTQINLTNNTDFKIRHVWLNLYHGGFGPGAPEAPQDVSIYMDNLVIAKSYIGPVRWQ